MRSRCISVLTAALVLACASPALAQTWTAVGPPGNPVVQAFVADPSNPATIFAGTAANGVYVSTDSGGSWSASNVGLTSQNVTAFAAFLPGLPPGVPPAPVVYAGTSDAGVFVSLDRGATWAPAINGLTNLQVSALAIASTTGTLYAATRGGVFRLNGSGTWTPASAGLTSSNIAALAIDPSNPQVLFAGSFGSLFRTTDGGASWSPVFTSVTDRFASIAVDPFSSSNVYAGTVFAGAPPPVTDPTGSFIRSTNGGTAWSAAGNGLPNIGVTAIAIDKTASSRVYAGTSGGGTFLTKNFAASWTAQNTGLSDRHVVSMTVAPTSPSTVYAGTQASGAYKAVSDAVGVCAVGATNLCLQANRFRVEVAWSVPADGRAGSGQAIPVSSDTGTFWFFESANYEMMIKVLDGRAVNGHIWVFYGALSNVQYTITVTDTQTAAVKTYFNPQDTLASRADTSAF
jgi:photosystem II stability/assembly factor-like uncharacterized protein